MVSPANPCRVTERCFMYPSSTQPNQSPDPNKAPLPGAAKPQPTETEKKVAADKDQPDTNSAKKSQY